MRGAVYDIDKPGVEESAGDYVYFEPDVLFDRKSSTQLASWMTSKHLDCDPTVRRRQREHGFAFSSRSAGLFMSSERSPSTSITNVLWISSPGSLPHTCLLVQFQIPTPHTP
ncbi:hypothetical protein EVG20_g3338 [Dentipellis fragilis]|uniref:Uncharacterized protein n=1 Tax=Dentipellis fragilis TaxID=205917 RepID=A0A4Y9Z560_9AGAM|nr:hypothetical protein EVG20_g3338 [Dentipellis fragilis]